MKLKILLSLVWLLIVGSLVVGCNPADEPEKINTEADTKTPVAYLDVNLSFEQRVDDLIGRMTLAEKISQMYNEAPAIDRLGVPEYNWWNEALHGVARAGKATVFPQAIGMAATFDEPLMFDIASAIADEGRAKYHYFVENKVVFRYTGLTFWSPNINIFRDPRWGRGQETYGEDPFLTGSLAVDFIRGLQGDDEKYLKTAATAKHFAVHSGPEKTRHSDNYQIGQKDLFETYLPAFEKAVKDAKVEAVMCAYNRVNDAPACGSDKLLKEILRGEYQFNGHVVSDCGAIADFYDPLAHAVVKSPAEAAASALKSGTDLNCGTDRLSTFTNLHFALQRKMVDEATIDTAVKRLFMTRFKLGMFDPPEKVPFTQIPMSVVGSEKHLALARKAAEKSLVLLKNDGVLPLKPDTKVAVIGPNANNIDVLLGNYNGTPINPVTPLEAIRNRVGADNVHYAPGTALIGDVYAHYTTVGEQNFFHLDENGELQPGLLGSYYPASLESGRAEVPTLSRVDKNIDFYWQKSPLDQTTVWGEFGITWKGLLIPEKSGEYRFQTRETLIIDGLEVTGSLQLNAGQHYQFEASQNFLRTWWGNPLEPFVNVSWINLSTNLVAEAVKAAEQADIVIFFGGISPRLEGEEMPLKLAGFDYGDRTDLKLPIKQLDLLEVLQLIEKPIVFVNFSGSAMALNWENENLNAIVQAFYPGEGTGTALANLLWGEYNPAGRLPITFYKSVKDLPQFNDYSMANRTYKYFKGKVLYPFGYGLSYTSFQYLDLKVSGELQTEETLSLSTTVTNTGEVDGEEVVQLYMSLLDAPVVTPIRELKAFRRVPLAAGESRPVEFKFRAEDIFYVDNDGEKQKYKGNVLITIGGGQKGFVPSSALVETTLSIE